MPCGVGRSRRPLSGVADCKEGTTTGGDTLLIFGGELVRRGVATFSCGRGMRCKVAWVLKNRPLSFRIATTSGAEAQRERGVGGVFRSGTTAAVTANAGLSVLLGCDPDGAVCDRDPAVTTKGLIAGLLWAKALRGSNPNVPPSDSWILRADVGSSWLRNWVCDASWQ